LKELAAVRRNLLLLVFAVLAGVVVYDQHRRVQEALRMQSIERLGGFVDHGGAFIVLGGRDVTDAALEHLRRFPELEYLALPETAVTPSGISRLRGFNLVGLEVLRSPVSPPFYVQVAALPKLKVLKMIQTGTTDECLIELARLPELEVLDLSNCPISAEGVGHLVTLKNLRVLSLYATNVNDNCIDHLRKMPRLEQIDVEHTRVSSRGVSDLHDASPNCRITF
jgi:hypothetical protein